MLVPLIFPWIEERPASHAVVVDAEEMVGFVVIARGTGQSEVIEIIGSAERFRKDMLQMITNTCRWLRRKTILTAATGPLFNGFTGVRLSWLPGH